MTKNTLSNKKKNNLFVILSGIFLTNAIVAELIGAKIFSLESTFGYQPAGIPLLGGYVLDFNLTAGVILWPVVFLTTDVINEYFGKEGVRKISLLTVGFIAYGFVVIYLATVLAPAQFWLDIYETDAKGNRFDINFAFSTVFRQGTRIIFASLVAFLIGQLLDVFVFQKLRKMTGSGMIWLRATGSTLVSQLMDSYVVLFLAFYFLAPQETRWSVPQVLSVGVINYIYKFVVAIVLTPLIYLAHYLIDRYLGEKEARAMADQAADKSSGFF